MSTKEELKIRLSKHQENIRALRTKIHAEEELIRSYQAVIGDLDNSNAAVQEAPPMPEKKRSTLELSVEILTEGGRWLTKKELYEALYERGFRSVSPKPANSMQSTINSDIRDRRRKGLRQRVIRHNMKYGLPEWKDDLFADGQEIPES